MNIIKVIEILPQDVFLRSATLFTTAFSEEIIGLSSCNRINLKCNIFYLLKKDKIYWGRINPPPQFSVLSHEKYC